MNTLLHSNAKKKTVYIIGFKDFNFRNFIGCFRMAGSVVLLKARFNWANVCSQNILRTVRRAMIRFLIELLVRRTWFGQFDEL